MRGDGKSEISEQLEDMESGGLKGKRGKRVILLQNQFFCSLYFHTINCIFIQIGLVT